MTTRLNYISPWIHTTNRCNLNCNYCYIKGNEDMPQRVYSCMLHFLDWDVKGIHLRFAGGEPLLVFNEWEIFAREMLKDDRVTVEVLTNFQEVPETFWDFANLDKVNISISIDGGTTCKPLSGTILEKTRKLRNPWILTTITKDNIEHLDVIAAFVGIRGYGWCLTTDYFNKNIVSWQKLSIELQNIIEILKLCEYDFTKISFNNCTIRSNFSACKAGKEMFTIAPNGDIYACQTLIRKDAKLGTVGTGYGTNPIKQQGCDNCNANDICKGWCPLYHKPHSDLCNVMKIFSNEIIKEYKNA